MNSFKIINMLREICTLFFILLMKYLQRRYKSDEFFYIYKYSAPGIVSLKKKYFGWKVIKPRKGETQNSITLLHYKLRKSTKEYF